MKENKAEGKESEDEGVFFGFGDDGAMDAKAQAVFESIISPTPQNSVALPVAGVSVLRIGIEQVGQVKVANGLGHRRRPNPVHIGLAGAVGQLGGRSEIHVGNGVGAARDSVTHGGHIGGGVRDGDVVVGVGCAQFDGLAEPRSQRLEV